MQVEKYYWKRPEAIELFGKLWIPDVPLDALVVLVHGIGEHGGCYDEWAERFTEHSIGFLALDLRGHGRSSGKRGYASLDAIKNDLRTVVKCMRKKFPEAPIVLFGNSMGGHIVLSYALDKNVNVQGIIASSPWLELVNPPKPWLTWLAKAASSVVPWVTVSTGIRADQLAHGGVGVKSSKTDPLIHKKISIKLFSDLWANSQIIMRNKHKLNIPLLLMHGTADKLTSYQASKAFAQNAGEFVTYKQWRGMGHYLLNDPENEVVFQYMVKWISKQIKKDGAVQNNRKMYRVA